MAKVTFYSPVYPNIELLGGKMRIKFENGAFATDNEKEIAMLKSAGFLPHFAEGVMPEPIKAEKPKKSSKEDK